MPYLVVCLRKREDHSNTIGWKGGDCLKCQSDYLAKGRGDFIPNSECKGYIFCRIINVK